MSMETIPQTHRFIAADILTSGYRIVGKVTVTTTGVMGLMNDPTHSVLDVHDAKLARLHMPTKLVDHFETVRLIKNHLFVICVGRREDLGPHALVRGGYTNVVEYPVRVTTQIYEIEGILETPGRFDFSAIMAEGTREFVPVFNAVVTAILIPNLRVDSPGLLFNRRQLDLLALLSQRVKPT
jgi:hypothetical protein